MSNGFCKEVVIGNKPGVPPRLVGCLLRIRGTDDKLSFEFEGVPGDLDPDEARFMRQEADHMASLAGADLGTAQVTHERMGGR